MTRRLARRMLAGTALLVALGCSGCGSARHAVAVKHLKPKATARRVRFALPPEANLVVLPPMHGVGNESLGTFTPHGTVDLVASCKGKGFLTIVRVSRTGPCDGGQVGIGVPGAEGKQFNLVVHAQPGTTWRLAVGEEIPGTALTLVHRSGVGNAKLGAFRLRGTIQISLSCTGAGNLDLESRADPAIPGIGTTCPQSRIGTTSHFLRHSREAEFEIQADRKVRWSVAVTETPAK